MSCAAVGGLEPAVGRPPALDILSRANVRDEERSHEKDSLPRGGELAATSFCLCSPGRVLFDLSDCPGVFSSLFLLLIIVPINAPALNVRSHKSFGNIFDPLIGIWIFARDHHYIPIVGDGHGGSLIGFHPGQQRFSAHVVANEGAAEGPQRGVTQGTMK